MRTPEEIERDIKCSYNAYRRLKRQIEALRWELECAEHFANCKGWVALRHEPPIEPVMNEHTLFPVSDRAIWHRWANHHGFVVRNKELKVIYDYDDGLPNFERTVAFGQSRNDIIGGIAVGFFAAEAEARNFIAKK
jgi:hypothetical protein